MAKKLLIGLGLGLVMLAAGAGGYAYWHAKLSPGALSKEVIRSKLNDPDSAVFRNHREAIRGGVGVWCGEVNARNRMGGMIGFTRYVAAIYPDRELDVLDDITFDEQQDSFAGKWQLMCVG